MQCQRWASEEYRRIPLIFSKSKFVNVTKELMRLENLNVCVRKVTIIFLFHAVKFPCKLVDAITPV